MSKKERFLWVVQTGCLSRALKEGWAMGHPIRIMAAAVNVPEEAIPEDIDSAAFSFLQWQFRFGADGEDARPPEWLAAYVKGSVGETSYWKF
jgi:hypothetical protein